MHINFKVNENCDLFNDRLFGVSLGIVVQKFNPCTRERERKRERAIVL